MTNYTPKPGDSVKATLGDSVIYGAVSDVTKYDEVLVRVNGSGWEANVTGWQIEPWVRPVEFKPLTILRLQKDSLSFLLEDSDEEFRTETLVYRTAEDVWFSTPGYEVDEWEDEDMAKLIAAGKAEILFEGVEQ